MRYRSVCIVGAVAGLAASTSAQCGKSSASSSWSCGSKSESVVQRTAYTAADDIVATAKNAGQFETLLAAAKAAGLAEALMGEGPFTVFAPTDRAFSKLGHGKIEELLRPENRETLRSILTYHVVAGEVKAGDVVRRRTLETIGGQRVDVETRGDRVMIDGARVTATDIEASNGVIHVIDGVLMPATKSIPGVADDAGSFSTLLKAVKAAGLSETLMGEGPFTVFAPTDEAFEALGSTVHELLEPKNRHRLTDILTYHVVPGRVYANQALQAGEAATVEGSKVRFDVADARLLVDGATIVSTDIEASNGVIHVIDRVLMP